MSISAPDTSALTSPAGSRPLDAAHHPSIAEVIESLAAAAPDKPALVFEGRCLTYQELNRAADRLAADLARRGVGPDVFVGLCARNSLEMIVEMFGILKAGGAYVPLDPDLPRARLHGYVSGSKLHTILTQPALLGTLAGVEVPCLSLEAMLGEDAAAARVRHHPAQAAYAIYTSGSTGEPKAVQIPCSALLNHVHSFRLLSGLSADDRCMLFSSFAFDGSVEEIFGPLLSGATLVIPREVPIPLAALNPMIETHRLTMLDFTVGYWNVWIQFLAAHRARIPATVRRVVIGGELIRAPQLRAWEQLTRGQDIDLVITYGPTEATVIAAGMIYRPNDHLDGLLGRPLENITVHLLDPDLNPVSPGETGLVYIGGMGLARGYAGAARLTAERFIPNPFGRRPGERLYCTGDRARELDGSVLQFMGREDIQVKVRGYRVELAEVENALCAFPGVQAAAAVAVPSADGTLVLGAFVLPAGQQTVTEAALCEFLRSRLPEFMLPNRIEVLASFPVKPNGKTDREALATLWGRRDAPRAAPVAAGEPENQRLVAMRALFASVLGLPDVAADDNFFRAGGHSLLVMQLLSRLRVAEGATVSLKDFFLAPTPRQFARLVADVATRAVPAPGIARRPPMRLQGGGSHHEGST